MIGSFQKAPPTAWSGWRLRIPGGPEGGQYHGFVAQDAHDHLMTSQPAPGRPSPYPPPAPWDPVWGGVALLEGENRSDYVYRSSAEMRPRSNASGGANVVSALQTRKTAGYAEAPGNYRSLGNFVACPEFTCPNPTGYGPPPCYTPVCGATSIVTQPPPPRSPGSGYVTNWTIPPVSPQPSPTVSATPAAASGSWFTDSTLVPGVENLWIAAAAAAAAYFMLRSHL